MKRGVIYCYTNKINGKCYIGLTTNEGVRKVQHLKDALNYDSKRPFHCAIRKYGIDSFEYTVLEELNNHCEKTLKKELALLEMYYIGKFDSYEKGYNNTLGGDGTAGCKHSEEEKLAKSIRQGSPILQYDLNNVFIAEHKSSGLAAKSLNKTNNISDIASRISAVCSGKRKTAYGYKWFYK